MKVRHSVQITKLALYRMIRDWVHVLPEKSTDARLILDDCEPGAVIDFNEQFDHEIELVWYTEIDDHDEESP